MTRPPGAVAGPTFRNVQVLRGLAAAMVVVLHGSENWAEVTSGSTAHAWWNGTAGVDLFFVISGFVMAISALGKGDGPGPARRFFERRLVRVLPLYWIITTALLLKIQLGLVRSAQGMHHVPLGFGVCSYLLIPHWNANGDASPLLAPGWTLSYEMLFYLCFAAALWMRRSVPWSLTLGLGLLVCAGFFRTATWPAVGVLLSPLLLEFLGGLWIGQALRKGHKLPAPLAAVAGGAALLTMLLVPSRPVSPLDFGREHLVWGLCALVMVWSAVSLERSLGPRMPRWALLVGDASYSLYLAHAPLLGFCSFLLTKMHVLVAGRVRLQDEWITDLFCLLFSLAAGILVYRLVELPVNRFFQHRLGLRRPVQTEAAG